MAAFDPLQTLALVRPLHYSLGKLDRTSGPSVLPSARANSILLTLPGQNILVHFIFLRTYDGPAYASLPSSLQLNGSMAGAERVDRSWRGECSVTNREWLQRARELAAKQSSEPIDDEEKAKAAFSSAYRLLDEAPQGALDAYNDIAEDALVDATTDAVDRLTDGNSSWSMPAAGTLAEVAFQAGVRVRALDQRLHDLSPVGGPPADPNEDFLCRETDAFVMPRSRPRSIKVGAGGRTHFRRRGTIFFRVLPRTVGSYTIELSRLDVIDDDVDHADADGRGSERGSLNAVLGAAMFEDFRLVPALLEEGTFRADRVECKGLNAAIRRHVDEARRQGCLAVVWPELTMPPDKLRVLQDKLAEGADLGPAALQWVLSGSWHVGAQTIENVAEVLDRYGESVAKLKKSLPYRSNDLGREGIRGSYIIPVMLTADHVIAFATCLDFCDARNAAPYANLDVDLIVVGSMGDERTILAHRAQAQASTVLGKRVFIVQQKDRPSEVPTGWVLPPLADVQSLSGDDMLEGTWSTHEWIR